MKRLLVWLLVSAAPAHAGVFGPDNRESLPPTGKSHATAIVGHITTTRPVPMLVTKNHIPVHPLRFQSVYTASTAFMVSPCHALTNFHSVFGQAVDGDKNHTVTMTIQGSKPYKVIGTPVTWGTPFYMENDHVRYSVARDWTLLKVTCVGLDPLIGWGIPRWGKPDAPEPSIEFDMLHTTGYPGDKPLDRPWTATCAGHKIAENMLFHDCATFDGASGSPIYILPHGMPVIVAMVTAGTSGHHHDRYYTTETANVGVLFNTIWSDISYFVNDAIDHFGVENPQIALARQYDEP